EPAAKAATRGQAQHVQTRKRRSPPPATRCHVRSRCPRNNQSTTGGSKYLAATPAGPSSRRRTSHIALQRNRRTRARAAADSGADRTDGSPPSASPWLSPHCRLPIALTFAHCHGRSVVRDVDRVD